MLQMPPEQPPVIEGRYHTVSIDGRPARQPIFNHWRYAMPLVGYFAIRYFFAYAPQIVWNVLGVTCLALVPIAYVTTSLRHRKIKRAMEEQSPAVDYSASIQIVRGEPPISL